INRVPEGVSDEAYLPGRVGDVLGDVDGRSVRPHQDLLLSQLFVPEDPAALVLPLRLEDRYPLGLQLLEEVLPHPRRKDMGLPVEKVVPRPQPPARLELVGQDSQDYLVRVLVDVALSALYLLEDEPLLLLKARILLVHPVNPRIDDVAAVHVELHARGRLVAEPLEPQTHYDVGHLR